MKDQNIDFDPGSFFEAQVPAEPESLAILRLMVTTVAADLGYSQDSIDKLEVAVDEACSNIVEHAYGGMDQKEPIELRIGRETNGLLVEIVDRGKAFDMSSHNFPTFPDHWDEGNTRGVGLYLIHQCMDDVHYERLPDNSNHLQLRIHNG